MIRTKRVEKDLEIPSGLMGGHMPNPPAECTKTIVLNRNDNRRYINTVFCMDCVPPCIRRREFNQEWDQYREWKSKK